MKEYELIVHKVDSKGGVVGSFGPLYLVNDKMLNFIIEELIVNLQISSKLSKESLKTICKLLKNDPSFTSIKPNVFESLRVLTQPETSTFLSM